MRARVRVRVRARVRVGIRVRVRGRGRVGLTLRGSGRGKKGLPECESCSRLHRSGSVALGRRPISSRRCSRPGVLPRSFCEMSRMQPLLSGHVTARQLMPSSA